MSPHLRQLLARTPIHDFPRVATRFRHHQTLRNALGGPHGPAEATADDPSGRAGGLALFLLLGLAILRFSRVLSSERRFGTAGAGGGGLRLANKLSNVSVVFETGWGMKRVR